MDAVKIVRGEVIGLVGEIPHCVIPFDFHTIHPVSRITLPSSKVTSDRGQFELLRGGIKLIHVLSRLSHWKVFLHIKLIPPSK